MNFDNFLQCDESFLKTPIDNYAWDYQGMWPELHQYKERQPSTATPTIEKVNYALFPVGTISLDECLKADLENHKKYEGLLLKYQNMPNVCIEKPTSNGEAYMKWFKGQKETKLVTITSVYQAPDDDSKNIPDKIKPPVVAETISTAVIPDADKWTFIRNYEQYRAGCNVFPENAEFKVAFETTDKYAKFMPLVKLINGSNTIGNGIKYLKDTPGDITKELLKDTTGDITKNLPKDSEEDTSDDESDLEVVHPIGEQERIYQEKLDRLRKSLGDVGMKTSTSE